MIILKRQKYAVKLTCEERRKLKKIKCSKSAKELTKIHAKLLLLLDENNPESLTPKQVAKKVKLHVENVYVLRKQYVREGLKRALNRKKRETPPMAAKVTGEVEAHIIATACSEVPEGKEHWTLSAIANKIVLDGVIKSISGETVRRVLKKRNLSLI
jgi:transposase